MFQRRTIIGLSSVAVLTLGLVVQAFLPSAAGASQITNRSLTLQAGAADGGSKPGGTVNHLLSFTIPSNTNIGSIQFLYCATASGTCTMPHGLVTTGATLGTQTGVTGFTLNNLTNGSPYLTRAAGTPGTGAATYQLLSVVNPDGQSCSLTSPQNNNCTFYVRISTFASIDTTGSATDTGTVAASTAIPIILTGVMPESLVFCTGGTVGTTIGVPDCSTATSGSVSFDRLFSPTDTAIATSQMAASTNAGFGYVITVNGATLTSGSNTVTAINTAGGRASIKGISQFGLNLKANTTASSNPAVGTEVAPVANGTNYRGEALNDYSIVDKFKFISGESVADSANGGAGGTDAQIFTTAYIVNVPGSQPAGTYTTTVTYICTPTF